MSNIDKLTIGEARQIASMFGGTSAAPHTVPAISGAQPGPHLIGQHVLVRTYSAGVHIGTLADMNGQIVTLTNCRRIWKWYGALELYAVSQRGLDPSKSTLSVAAPQITLTQAIEIFPTSEAARATFDKAEAKSERA